MVSRSPRFSLAGLVLASIAFTPREAVDGKPILGFTAAGSAAEHALEAKLDASIAGADLDGWLKRLSSQPNHVGSPHDRENAQWLAAQFRSWGYETRIETFQVLFPTPRVRVLEMLRPKRFTPKLQEPTLAQDATSKITDNRLPPYNAYSADGDVTGELVYVNYGVPDDYDELARRGIDVKGKIVIARYGGSWRGIKPKVAAEHGAIGCILYSDPRDDGYYRGDVYPEGPYRMAYGAQRGSVEDMPTYPGDPLTPGVGATADAKRMTVQESPVIMKIPVMPISYADAQPLLEALEGPVAPSSWRGALPMTYHIGPGPTAVHLRLEFDWSLKPVNDVIAVLPGSTYPDEWVMHGNHFDGWVFGAEDPLSGMVPELAEARAIGELARSGWRPKRTIVFAAWDGEEPGLLGSTEWAEQHADELKQKLAVYVNTDGNGRGFLGVGGSHALERFVNQVARDLTDPERQVTVWERARAARAVNGNAAVLHATDLDIFPLGSGSDYTPFLQHLGVSALNVGYGGEGGGGSYHSIFDSYDFYTRFGDPGQVYGFMLAKTTGRMTLRLANADVLPFRFSNLARHVGDYVKEVKQLAADMREQTEHANALHAAGAYTLAADPTETYVPPESKDPVPYLNFAPLENGLAALEASAERYDSTLTTVMAAGGPTSEQAQRVNAILTRAERSLTSDAGLPRRGWFKHTIYAPGFYTGYGVKTLPGVREAIEQRQWQEMAGQAEVIGAALTRMAETINGAAAAIQ